MIQDVFRAAQTLESVMPIVYLPDYGMESAKLMCAGVDVWLNTPLKPHEASGTSGMKAALNGVPQFGSKGIWRGSPAGRLGATAIHPATKSKKQLLCTTSWSMLSCPCITSGP